MLYTVTVERTSNTNLQITEHQSNESDPTCIIKSAPTLIGWKE